MPTTRRRRVALRGLARLRTAVKRLGIVSALVVGELEAWRSRILELEERARRAEDELGRSLDAEYRALVGAELET